MNENQFKKLNFSTLGKGSSLKGEFKFSGETLINCRLQGNVTMVDDGRLVFEREANFEGEIYCADIEVFGNLKGSIHASGTLSIRSSATISGVINAKKISIFPGAHLNIEGHTITDQKDNKEHAPLS